MDRVGGPGIHLRRVGRDFGDEPGNLLIEDIERDLSLERLDVIEPGRPRVLGELTGSELRRDQSPASGTKAVQARRHHVTSEVTGELACTLAEAAKDLHGKVEPGEQAWEAPVLEFELGLACVVIDGFRVQPRQPLLEQTLLPGVGEIAVFDESSAHLQQ